MVVRYSVGEALSRTLPRRGGAATGSDWGTHMDEPVIVPLPGKTNAQIVFESLESIIKDGYWKPDEKIPSEAELRVRFNVGRSTIREALNMLKAKNMLYTLPGLGTYVSKPQMIDPVVLFTHIPNPESEQDLLNIMEVRLSFEPINAALAARRASREQIEEIRRVNEVLIAAIHDDARMFAESDISFHMLIAEATGNPMLADVMKTVQRFLQEQQILTSQHEWRRNTAEKFHMTILEAIEGGNERAAEDLMREHMDDTYIYVKSLVNISERRSGRWIPRKSQTASSSRKRP